jgi:hypothetical protein
MLVIGHSAANLSRDIPSNRLKVNVNKLREFRDVLTFGQGVYLPRDKFSEEKHTICTATIEDITKRLADSVEAEHPWNRPARQLLQTGSSDSATTDTT